MSDNKRVMRSQSKKDNPERLRMKPAFDYINTLNDDCLAEIFTYLSVEDRLKIKAVCKRWRGKSELVWRDIRTLDFESRRMPGRFKRMPAFGFILQKSGNYLRQLKLGQCSGSAVLPLVAVHCPNLQWLQMKLQGSNCIECCALLTELERLEYLSLAASPSNFSQNFFDTLSCRNLINLKLSSIGEICWNSPNPARVSRTIFEKLPKLSSLSVRNFRLTEDVLMAIFRNANLVHIFVSPRRSTYPSLKLINLEHLDLMDTITDSFLSQVSNICKNLRYLRLDGTQEVTDAGLIELRKLPQLEELDIVLNDNITDEPFSRMHTLKRLICSCRRVRDNGIITLMKYAPNLQFLYLTYSGVTKRVLTEASTIVKKRSNGLELKIIVSDHVKSQWEPGDVSPLLVVKTWIY